MDPEYKNNQFSDSEDESKPYRSLWYMGIGLGLIVLVMGYLTFYVDDATSIFSSKKEVTSPQIYEDNSNALDDNLAMNDEEVKTSLIKFIEAFYNDQKKGYFDPPSYFPTITQTYYNFHNLSYQRIKEVHWKRLEDMKNLELTWDVFSLEYERNGNDLIAKYIARLSYFQPSRNMDVTTDVRYEMIINEEGKISSLRECEILNRVENPHSNQNDSVSVSENESIYEQKPNSQESQTLSESSKLETSDNAKLYDLGNVETAPEYRGGQKALNMFLASRLKYPSKAKENKIQGKVYVAFIIEKNGNLSDFKIIRGLGSGCDEEAIHVLKLSTNWKPGYVNGSPVRTSYVLPVSFQLKN